MACGLPVITTDVGGNAELVRHGENGLVTPVADPEALAAAMKTLLSNKAYADRLAEEGLRDVRQNHSAHIRAQRIFKLYEQIAVSKGIKW
jgi:glycosyltransferase involved in cell wall biosynthesis